MSTYHEVLRQVERLTPDEQLRLIEELAALVRRRVLSEHQRRRSDLQGLGKDKWRGFLPERVDALAFQLELRREWDE